MRKLLPPSTKTPFPFTFTLTFIKRIFVLHWNRGFIDYSYLYGVGGGDEDEGVGDDGR